MDFFKKTLAKPNLLKLLTFMLTIFIVNSQLSSNDLNYIRKSILGSQKDNGLFAESFEDTFRSAYVLKVLNEKIPENNKICKEVHFQSMKEVSIALVELNELLKCKIDFEIEMKQGEAENLNEINSLHEKVLIWRYAKNVDWKDLYSKIKPFIKDTGLFSEVKKSTQGVLDATVKGLEILQIIYDKVAADTKEELKSTIVSTIKGLNSFFQPLAHVIN